MKYILFVPIVAGSSMNCFAQGLINFNNTPSTLISYFAQGPIGGQVGGFEFALLASPVGAKNFSFAGVYGTNTTTPGIFTGGAGVAVPGWAAGTSRDFAVFGWDTGPGGLIYNSSWLKPDLSWGSIYPSSIAFGLSDISTGIAGGVTGSGTVPTLNLFGGPTGIQNGFRLSSPLPEPSSLGLGALGGILVLLYRRKRNANNGVGDKHPDKARHL